MGDEIAETVLLVLAILLFVALGILAGQKHTCKLEELGRLPPGPRRWPVVGNMFQLGWSAHESFAKLANKHGPIMTLWLGSMCTVVLSSNDMAREMFKNHDVVLAGRKIYEAMIGDFGNEGSLITAQYGPHWRMLRRLCTTEFFVTSRLDATVGVRGRCIDQMVKYIEAAGGCGTNAIDVGRFFFLMSFNLIGNLMFSKDLLDPNSERGAKFFYHASKVMEFAGKPNIADFLPMIKWLDPQGLRKRTQFHVKQAFDIAGWYLKERKEESMDFIDSNGNNSRRDYLDVLLEYREDSVEGPPTFSSRTINVIVFAFGLFPFSPTWHCIIQMLPNLSTHYGPLLRPRIASSSSIIVSNAAVVEDMLKTNEMNFVSRPHFGCSDYDIYDGYTFIFSEYGNYWRFLKKLCMTELLSVPRVSGGSARLFVGARAPLAPLT
ncbi:hypothetical protein ACH5RR_007395 [Cinchona calisaya]|uniref:Cytochrome P450 n=1 Tax=Cinchona calisaya TaxID=153742 RepID=A0ABD3ARU4_9GENT